MSSSPGVPRSTMKARCPARPALRSTVAQTTIQSARIEFEMKVLAPFSTHASPARTAVVWMAATSLPAPGSVMAKAFAAGMAQEATGLAVEILGDAGVTRDAYVEKLYRDVKAMDIVEGTGQIQRIVIARRLVGLPR